MAEYKVEILEDICKGCTLCVSACPKNLFKVSKELNAKGYNPAEWLGRPVFFEEGSTTKMDDPEKYSCIGCEVCYKVCPEAAIKIKKKSLGAKVVEDE